MRSTSSPRPNPRTVSKMIVDVEFDFSTFGFQDVGGIGVLSGCGERRICINDFGFRDFLVDLHER